MMFLVSKNVSCEFIITLVVIIKTLSFDYSVCVLYWTIIIRGLLKTLKVIS